MVEALGENFPRHDAHRADTPSVVLIKQLRAIDVPWMGHLLVNPFLKHLLQDRQRQRD